MDYTTRIEGLRTLLEEDEISAALDGYGELLKEWKAGLVGGHPLERLLEDELSLFRNLWADTRNLARNGQLTKEEERVRTNRLIGEVLAAFGRFGRRDDPVVQREIDMRAREEADKGPSINKDLTNFLPRRAESDIVGRERELEELRKILLAGQKVVVVNGMGGIGKTTLAEVYVEKHYADYQHLAWITQENEDLAFDFFGARSLQANLGIKGEGMEVKDVFREVVRVMKGIEGGPCLLVIDNAVESVDRYLDVLPKGPKWHVLFTSRESILELETLALDELEPGEALVLFQKYCPRIKDIPEIQALLKEVEYHTLTVELLAKTAKRQQLSIEQLRNALKENVKSGAKTRHNKQSGRIDRIMSYLESIFDLQQLDEGELWLMKQWTCLPPTYIPYETLRELLQIERTDWTDSIGGLLVGLVEKGWLASNAEENSFKVHRIVADVVWNKLGVKEEDVELLIEAVTDCLKIDESKDNPIDKFIWELFGKTIATRFQVSEYSRISFLQNELALVLRALGDYHGAKELLKKAVASYIINFGEEHPNTASKYCNLAEVLRLLGDFQKAKGLLEKAIYIYEKHLGENHPYTAVAYSNLAIVLKALGDYQGAKELLEKAMVSNERNFGPDHPTTAVPYSNLAMVLQDLGDYQGAKILMEKAVVSAERNFGDGHPYTATRYSNLALVLKGLGDYQGAKELLEKAIASDEINFGEHHPSTAIRYSNLAMVLKNLQDYQGAKRLLEKVLESYAKNFGEQHSNSAIIYSNLALVLKGLGDYQGSKGLLEKAIASDELNFGVFHPSTARCYSILSDVLQTLGEYKKAWDLAKKTEEVFEKFFPKEHPYLLEAKRRLEQLRALVDED